MKGVPELVQFQKSPLVLGGGMSLTSVIDLMDEVSASNANYKYTKTIADHIRKVAHPSVRNAGTIAGNLMLKHAYPGITMKIFFLCHTYFHLYRIYQIYFLQIFPLICLS